MSVSERNDSTFLIVSALAKADRAGQYGMPNGTFQATPVSELASPDQVEKKLQQLRQQFDSEMTALGEAGDKLAKSSNFAKKFLAAD